MNNISRNWCSKLFCLYGYLHNCSSLRVRFVFKTNSRISSIFPYKNNFCTFHRSWDIKKTMWCIFFIHPVCILSMTTYDYSWLCMNDRAEDEHTDCTFDKNWMCVLHGCTTKKVEISVLKWRWVESRKQYGNVQTKITNLHCTANRIAPTVYDISPAVQLYSGGCTAGILAGRGLGTSVGTIQEIWV